MGTYSITEVKSHPIKFACMVSFNGKTPEYYEVEVPNGLNVPHPKLDEQGEEMEDEKGNPIMEDGIVLDEQFVASVLQQVADEQVVTEDVSDVSDEAIEVVDGQIKV